MSTTDDDLTDLAREDPEAADESAADLGRPAADDTVGLALSGGGYRAMLFHVGSLIRLNEAGWLSRVTRVASVSGGSITAGQLGLAWSGLTFDESGVATNFEDLVAGPVLDLAAHTVDVRTVLTGLWPGRISTRVQQAYDQRLFHGAPLQTSHSRATGHSSRCWPPTSPMARSGASPSLGWATGARSTSPDLISRSRTPSPRAAPSHPCCRRASWTSRVAGGSTLPTVASTTTSGPSRS